MKPIRVLLLSLSVAVGSPALFGEGDAEVPKPGKIAVPAGQRLELLNCDAETFAGFYRRYTGKLVKVSQDLRGTGYRLVVRGPLTNADAARFVENQLLLEGCVIKELAPGETAAKGTRVPRVMRVPTPPRSVPEKR
jgi:hypothetical protein